jgi:hypothetical protein
MEKAKGMMISGGKGLVLWENDVAVNFSHRDIGIKCIKFNFLTESLYVGCSDSRVIVRVI